MKLYLTCLFLSIVFCMAGIAGIVRVPEDQPTIQAGINAALDSDTVLVADNTYFENIYFRGKAITVASYFILDADTNHINNTIINGSQPSHPDSGSVVYFISGEDTASVLSGFTITGGTGTLWTFPGFGPERDGGGIYILNSGAKIENNNIIQNHTATAPGVQAGAPGILAANDVGNDIIISDNNISYNSATAAGNNVPGATVLLWAKETCLFEGNRVHHNVANATQCFAGGLYADGQQNRPGPYIIRNNIITDNVLNSPNGLGGGMYIQNCSPVLTNNIISGNVGTTWGGGILIVHWLGSTGIPEPVFINNTIVNNSTDGYGGGISITGTQAHAEVINTIVWGNSAPNGSQIINQNNSTIEVNYSDIQGGWAAGEGNIDADPLFEDPFACILTTASPCIDAGNPGETYSDPQDPANPGFALWPAMGSLTNDMGAYGGPGSAPIVVGVEALPTSAEDFPGSFQLFQNYPNPFNPATTIEFALPIAGFVSLKIYDVTGAAVATLVSEQLPAGTYQYQWDARGLASGVYIYRMEAANFSQSRKMLLIR